MIDPIRVLIVDDSVVVRRAVAEALSSDREIAVVGTASNGKIALQRIPELKPEVLILDIEMPESNGFDVLRALRRDYRYVRTIMFSTLTQRGAAQTIEALSLGADDYVSKPTSIALGGYNAVLKRVAAELIPKIRQFRPKIEKRPDLPEDKSPRPIEGTLRKRRAGGVPEVVAIGISTGGPDALSRVLPKLSKTFPVPLLIVQHMPPLFTRLLAERLDAHAEISVVEGADGVVAKPGVAYIAPGDYHMAVRKEAAGVVLSMSQTPPENSCRPAADVLFRSVAEVYGPNALGVIMTGMGQDGLKGLRAMYARGAAVVAQDQASSVVWGMPSFVVREGFADAVVPLDEMAVTVETFVGKGR